MIRVNQSLYDAAQELLAAGRWRVDPDRGILRADQDLLAGSPNTSGYLRLPFTLNGRRVAALAHRVMWEAHHGAIPEGLFVNHIDGDKVNNALVNLELVTPAGNMAHAHRTGLMDPVYAALRVVDDETAREIYKAAWSSGKSAKALAVEFGVTRETVRSIKYRHGYKNATAGLVVERGADPRITVPQAIVEQIRSLVAQGNTHTEVARATGVSRTHVRYVATGRGRHG